MWYHTHSSVVCVCVLVHVHVSHTDAHAEAKPTTAKPQWRSSPSSNTPTGERNLFLTKRTFNFAQSLNTTSLSDTPTPGNGDSSSGDDYEMPEVLAATGKSGQ